MPQFVKPSSPRGSRLLYWMSAAMGPVVLACYLLDRQFDSWIGRVLAAAYFLAFFLYAWTSYTAREDEMGQRLDLMTTRMAYRLTVAVLLGMLMLDGTPLMAGVDMDGMLLIALVSSTVFYGASRYWAEWTQT